MAHHFLPIAMACRIINCLLSKEILENYFYSIFLTLKLLRKDTNCFIFFNFFLNFLSSLSFLTKQTLHLWHSRALEKRGYGRGSLDYSENIGLLQINDCLYLSNFQTKLWQTIAYIQQNTYNIS